MSARIRVLWLKDGKVGHLNKARGLLRALGRDKEIDLIEWQLQWRFPWARALLSWLGRRGLWLPTQLVLRGLPCLDRLDLVVSAGGATQWPNAAIAAQQRVPNVFLGSLRRMAPGNFSLIASHDPPSTEPPFHRFELIPSMVTPEAAREAAQASGAAWGLLIGGDGEGLSWQAGDYVALLERFIQQARRAGARVWVATGRRTPEAVEARLRAMARESGLLAGGCWFRGGRGGPGLLAMMGACEWLGVTADSMSMIHESVSSGRKVVVVRPDGQHGNSRLQGNLAGLESAGHIVVQPLGELEMAGAQPDAGWSLIHGDPTASLAERVHHLLDVHTSS